MGGTVPTSKGGSLGARPEDPAKATVCTSVGSVSLGESISLLSTVLTIRRDIRIRMGSSRILNPP